jgi:hypothetical protein
LLLIASLTTEARAQQAAKAHQIGYLAFGSSFEHRAESLRADLRDLGYVEGKNITLVFRISTPALQSGLGVL